MTSREPEAAETNSMPTPSPSVDLKALRELLEGATFGEWRRKGLGVATSQGIIANCPVPQDGGVFNRETNATLIALTPTLARTVLDQANRLEAITREMAEAERIGDHWADQAIKVEARATLAESALAEARQKLAAIGKIAARMTKQANDADRSGGAFADIANLAKDKTHG
jgi:hypothetical protein